MQMRFIPAEGLGFTQAVRAGELIFIGGLMPVNESGAIFGSSLAAQTTFVFDKLKRVLAEAGATLADVVKHNVYLSGDGALSDMEVCFISFQFDGADHDEERRAVLFNLRALMATMRVFYGQVVESKLHLERLELLSIGIPDRHPHEAVTLDDVV